MWQQLQDVAKALAPEVTRQACNNDALALHVSGAASGQRQCVVVGGVAWLTGWARNRMRGGLQLPPRSNPLHPLVLPQACAPPALVPSFNVIPRTISLSHRLWNSPHYRPSCQTISCKSPPAL